MPSTEGFTAIFVSSFVMMRQTKTRAGSQGARRRQEEEAKGVKCSLDSWVLLCVRVCPIQMSDLSSARQSMHFEDDCLQ